MFFDAKTSVTGVEKGNAAIDIVLFMPLALFFLFAVTDGGLTLVEQARMRDSIRAGLQTEYDSEQGFALRSRSNAFEKSLSARDAQDLAEHLASSLQAQVQRAQSESPTEAVEVSIFSLRVNPETGNLLPSSAERIATAFGSGSGFPQSALIEGYPYRSRADYIREKLNAEAPSVYAEPLGTVFLSTGEVDSSKRFVEQVFLVYVDARAVVTGINPSFAESALGRFYGFQLQQLQSLRSAVS